MGRAQVGWGVSGSEFCVLLRLEGRNRAEMQSPQIQAMGEHEQAAALVATGTFPSAVS